MLSFDGASVFCRLCYDSPKFPWSFKVPSWWLRNPSWLWEQLRILGWNSNTHKYWAQSLTTTTHHRYDVAHIIDFSGWELSRVRSGEFHGLVSWVYWKYVNHLQIFSELSDTSEETSDLDDTDSRKYRFAQQQDRNLGTIEEFYVSPDKHSFKYRVLMITTDQEIWWRPHGRDYDGNLLSAPYTKWDFLAVKPFPYWLMSNNATLVSHNDCIKGTRAPDLEVTSDETSSPAIHEGEHQECSSRISQVGARDDKCSANWRYGHDLFALNRKLWQLWGGDNPIIPHVSQATDE